MERPEVIVRLRTTDGRVVTAHAMEQVGPEDCYNMLMRAVMHRYLTSEDVVPSIPRDVKDAMIRQSLYI